MHRLIGERKMIMRKIYVYYQPNKKDLKDQVGDCVIRAICKATGKTWLEVFDDLCEYARAYQSLPNQKTAYEPYLEELGFTYHKLKCRPKMKTVMEFRKDFKGTAICNVKAGFGGHFVTVQDGHVFDTWDSTDCKMYGYYSRD